MDSKKKIDTGRLWSKFQFIILGAALLVPLLSKLYGNKKDESPRIVLNTETESGTLAKALGTLEAESNPKALASNIVALPDFTESPKLVFVSKFRQIRFERSSLPVVRSLASEGVKKGARYSSNLLKIRKRLQSGEFEELILVNSSLGKKQALGSVYVELEKGANYFWVDTMDSRGKISSQEIVVKLEN